MKHCSTFVIPNLSTPPTQLKDLQRHREARLLGPLQGPVTGAEVLTGRQQQQHGQIVSKLQQLVSVHTVLVGLSGDTEELSFQYACASYPREQYDE